MFALQNMPHFEIKTKETCLENINMSLTNLSPSDNIHFYLNTLPQNMYLFKSENDSFPS